MNLALAGENYGYGYLPYKVEPHQNKYTFYQFLMYFIYLIFILFLQIVFWEFLSNLAQLWVQICLKNSSTVCFVH